MYRVKLVEIDYYHYDVVFERDGKHSAGRGPAAATATARTGTSSQQGDAGA